MARTAFFSFRPPQAVNTFICSYMLKQKCNSCSFFEGGGTDLIHFFVSWDDLKHLETLIQYIDSYCGWKKNPASPWMVEILKTMG